jgi:bifunctional non-homologous end joining protein LigD
VLSGSKHAAASCRKPARRRPRQARPAKPAAAATPKRQPRRKRALPLVTLPEGAKPAALPLTLRAAARTLVDRAPPGDDWIYEIKFDGYRLLARIDGGEVRLFTRNGNDWSSKLKGLQAALEGDAARRRAGTTARSSSPARTAHPTSTRCRTPSIASRTEHIQYYLFDLPYVRRATTCARCRWCSGARCCERCSTRGRSRAHPLQPGLRGESPATSCRTPAGCASRA